MPTLCAQYNKKSPHRNAERTCKLLKALIHTENILLNGHRYCVRNVTAHNTQYQSVADFEVDRIKIFGKLARVNGARPHTVILYALDYVVEHNARFIETPRLIELFDIYVGVRHKQTGIVVGNFEPEIVFTRNVTVSFARVRFHNIGGNGRDRVASKRKPNAAKTFVHIVDGSVEYAY